MLLNRVFDESTSLSDFSPEQGAQVQFLVRGILQFQQSQYLLWRDGSLPTEYYETRKNWVRWFANLPSVAPVIQSEKANGILYEEFYSEILCGDA